MNIAVDDGNFNHLFVSGLIRHRRQGEAGDKGESGTEPPHRQPHRMPGRTT
jgi:hypothetical protein